MMQKVKKLADLAKNTFSSNKICSFFSTFKIAKKMFTLMRYSTLQQVVVDEAQVENLVEYMLNVNPFKVASKIVIVVVTDVLIAEATHLISLLQNVASFCSVKTENKYVFVLKFCMFCSPIRSCHKAFEDSSRIGLSHKLFNNPIAIFEKVIELLLTVFHKSRISKSFTKIVVWLSIKTI